ncbi:hypothetical protein [Marinilactibacillus psychrotolerans]|uniref:hypothetical protein n=1 Tax=Marinilactibacillus psychrotolerans TaxID=191770 RepID=UPI001866D2E2|nr:hypothetical protein [Marinilactibacillus psychrotolerans]
MDIKTFVLEIVGLIKKEKVTIIISAIIVTILAIAIQLVAHFDFDNMNSEEEVSSVPAKLDLYIEQENLGAFANSYLIETLITEPEVVSEISSVSNVNISTILNAYAEENEVIYSTEDPINVERNTSSNIMMMTVNVGSSKDNTAVAKAYYNWFENTPAPFFNDKQIFLINEPELIDDPVVSNDTQSKSIQFFIVRAVIGLIFGTLVGVIVALLKVTLSDKIRYGFTYGWNTKDIYIKEIESTPSYKIAHDLLNSQLSSLAILSEQPISDDLKKEMNKFNTKNYTIYNQIANIPIEIKVDEFVFIIKRNETTKKWYSKQRNDLKLYPNSRVKIVEI